MVGGHKKETKTHHTRPLHATGEHGMEAGDFYLPCQLRSGELHHGWNNNFIEKSFCQKTSGMWGIKISDKLTIAGLKCHCSRAGMPATGPWSLYWLREYGRHSWLNSSGGGEIDRKSKLTISTFFTQCKRMWSSDRPLIPLLVEGGRPTRPTEKQLTRKKKLWEKIGMVGEKIKRRGKLTSVAFCRSVAGRYGSDWPLIPILIEGGQPAQSTEVKFDWK